MDTQVERNILDGKYGNAVKALYMGLQDLEDAFDKLRDLARRTNDARLINVIDSYVLGVEEFSHEPIDDFSRYLAERK